jgi:hypothetical protein
MMALERTDAGRTWRVIVTREGHGWNVREEYDDTLVRLRNVTDWHRVERVLLLFAVGTPLSSAGGSAR